MTILAASRFAWKHYCKEISRLTLSTRSIWDITCKKAIFPRPPRFLHASPAYKSNEKIEAIDPTADTERKNSVIRAIAWLTGFYSRKQVLGRSAIWIYRNTFNDLDYEAFFKVCKLPDSMNSWFLIAHLHLWLLMVRLKREGKDGEFLIKAIGDMFWEDVKQRSRELGIHSRSHITQGIHEWSLMFPALIIAYEEGLLLNDKILAAAIWRNLMGERSEADPTQLEVMVHYIRSQVKHMDSLDSELLLRKGKLELAPFIPHLTLHS